MSSIIQIFCLFAVIIGVPMCIAENTPLIPRSILFGNPEKVSPQLSPDGTKLAYLAPDANNILNVWIKDLSGQEEDKQITSDTTRDIQSFFWQYDNAHILYFQDQQGNENWHLYQTGITDKRTQDLTPFDDVTVHVEAYHSEYPNTVLLGMNLRDPTCFDIHSLNLETGDLSLHAKNSGQIQSWGIDYTLAARASLSYTSDEGGIIQVRAHHTAPWKELLRWEAQEPRSELGGFSPDNHALYVWTSIDNNTKRLLKIDLDTEEKTVLAEDPHYDLERLIRHPTTHVVEAVGVEREKLEWIPLDNAIRGDFEFLSNLGVFTPISRSLNNKMWVIAAQSDVHSTRYYLYNRSKKQLDFLFSVQPKLDQYPLSKMTPITFKARDGMQLHGYLTLPHGKKPSHLPTVLCVHGGPWARDSWGLNPQIQWLANRGYAVLQINYRGSTGYGKSHFNAAKREWSGKMHADLIDGKNWVIAKGYADPNKVAIFGGSYGGYATLVGLTFTPEAFCCGVDIVGPSNLLTLLATIPPYWSTMRAMLIDHIGDPEKEPEFLKACSPLFKADQIQKPLLIAQGANDPRVKQTESDQVVAQMRANHLPVTYLLFPDEGHGFVRPANRCKFFAAAEQFLEEHLGGRAEAPHNDEDWTHLLNH